MIKSNISLKEVKTDIVEAVTPRPYKYYYTLNHLWRDGDALNIILNGVEYVVICWYDKSREHLEYNKADNCRYIYVVGLKHSFAMRLMKDKKAKKIPTELQTQTFYNKAICELQNVGRKSIYTADAAYKAIKRLRELKGKGKL